MWSGGLICGSILRERDIGNLFEEKKVSAN